MNVCKYIFLHQISKDFIRNESNFVESRKSRKTEKNPRDEKKSVYLENLTGVVLELCHAGRHNHLPVVIHRYWSSHNQWHSTPELLGAKKSPVKCAIICDSQYKSAIKSYYY